MASDTATRLLDVAQALIQERGYHAFSFRDVAEEVGIKSASMHYHFPSKPDLAVALLQRYRREFVAAMRGIEGSGAIEKLEGFAGLFEASFEKGRMCLCGSIAADLNTLPEEVRVEVAAFWDELRDWVAGVIVEGMESGELRAVDASETAEALVGMLEGAMLSARVRGSAAPLDAARGFVRVGLVS